MSQTFIYHRIILHKSWLQTPAYKKWQLDDSSNATSENLRDVMGYSIFYQAGKIGFKVLALKFVVFDHL